jgi:predicted nucleotidyltransferase component of viral defense system
MSISGNIAASVRQRLKNLASVQGEDFQAILTRYCLERLLFRLSQSSYRDIFILKGALLFSIWSEQPHRATRDLDLLGRGDNNLSNLEQIWKEICQVTVDLDGLEFDPNTVTSQKIKEHQEYEGVRITVDANLAETRTRLKLQVDIGFGDAVVPAPNYVDYPTLLDYMAPNIQVYQKETVVAEKFQAMVSLGIANSRMKDFYDLWYLAMNFEFDGEILSQAMKATFSRRRTPLPKSNPLALTEEFFEDKDKLKQWQAFLNKTKIVIIPQTFQEIIALLQDFLMPPSRAIGQGEAFSKIWSNDLRWLEK